MTRFYLGNYYTLTCEKSEEWTMGNYGLDELITRWEREKLTTEQMIGQILLILRSLTERVRDLERWRWKQEKPDGK
jgi:hypothetical protein